MEMNSKYQSPDMIKYDEVIAIIANYPKAFVSEKEMAQILQVTLEKQPSGLFNK